MTLSASLSALQNHKGRPGLWQYETNKQISYIYIVCHGILSWCISITAATMLQMSMFPSHMNCCTYASACNLSIHLVAPCPDDRNVWTCPVHGSGTHGIRYTVLNKVSYESYSRLYWWSLMVMPVIELVLGPGLEALLFHRNPKRTPWAWFDKGAMARAMRISQRWHRHGPMLFQTLGDVDHWILFINHGHPWVCWTTNGWCLGCRILMDDFLVKRWVPKPWMPVRHLVDI